MTMEKIVQVPMHFTKILCYDILIDINECDESNGGCSHNCTNTEGSFECYCRDGYILNGDGRNCSGTTAIYIMHSCSILTDFNNIRLVDGSGPHEGRVEVYYAEQWGTVCDDLFDINDANVVCRQLGYPRAIRHRSRAYFGQGSGSIWLDNVHCVGTETSIYNCRHNGFGNHNCGHWEDVGVECQDIA